ncbi:DUF6387 family protein [Citrobacter sp. Cu096]|uniref:DUF6387 family protein n=1 Tax=Citrobacter sp. Cu096 TaxID=2985158 RepID=UPI0025775CE8|nr:DUF6387 family protein [Citrobacter sp. Cu096]MDM2739533.1 DUF6387 family protein [Citrobacter sp. Cu096]
MKRAKYSDITEWFSLEKYDYILDLSVQHVIAEAFMMDAHYSSLEYRKETSFAVFPFPLIGDITLFHEDIGENELSFDDRGIMPLPFSMICAFVNSCLVDGRISINEHGKLEPRADIANHDVYNQPMLFDIDDPKSDGSTGIFVDIGLDLMSDEEMIAGFKILLRKWREQTGIKERSSDARKRFGLSTIAKIHHYRVIPYLDIARWARINDMSVSNELYARLLFPSPLPNGEVKGGAHIRDTVKPFAECARDLLNRTALKKYYADNPHIENMRFSEFLKLADFQ